MKTLLTIVAGTLALLNGAANSTAEIALDNIEQPDQQDVQIFGAGTGFARVFTTGADALAVSSVTLKQQSLPPPSSLEVRIYRVTYLPGIFDPALELMGILSNPTVDPNLGPGFVSYTTNSPITLESSSTYAVALWERPDGLGSGVGTYFTDSDEFTGIMSGWQVEQDVFGVYLGIDSKTGADVEYWWADQSYGHLKFKLEGEVVNQPPDVTNAYASVSVLWPPNGKMIPVQILGVVDWDRVEGDPPVSITITRIEQDEAVKSEGHDSTSPDATPMGDTALLRAERFGEGNGRVYTIFFTASDVRNATSTGSVQVTVPHDRGTQVLDDGPATGYFDSTAP